MDFSKHIKPLAGETDWPIWKRKIRDLLDYHEGAIDVIDGTLKKPDALEASASEIDVKKYNEKCNLFRKANSYAKSMLTSSVTDEVYQKIMDQETARDAWEALRLQFEATSKDQLFKICTNFFAFSWNTSNDVSTHIAKLKTLWNELNNGLKSKNENILPDMMLVCKILHILPSSFETFKSSWMLLTNNEQKTFDELTVQLCMYERNFNKKDEDDNSAQEALVFKYEKRKQENLPRTTTTLRNKREDICNFCKKKGHWVRDCKRWISEGRPTKDKVYNRSTHNFADTSTSLMSICNDVFATNFKTTDWWVDNGATRHVTNCSDWFVDFEHFDSPYKIQAAGKEMLNAFGKGTIRVTSTHNDKEVSLKDVWYVPSISRNLFSVQAAQDRNHKSVFKSTTTECWLDIDGKTVLYGNRQVNGSLYKAAIKPVLSKNNFQLNVAVEDEGVWN